jgi:hypothetical protein
MGIGAASIGSVDVGQRSVSSRGKRLRENLMSKDEIVRVITRHACESLLEGRHNLDVMRRPGRPTPSALGASWIAMFAVYAPSHLPVADSRTRWAWVLGVSIRPFLYKGTSSYGCARSLPVSRLRA